MSESLFTLGEKLRELEFLIGGVTDGEIDETISRILDDVNVAIEDKIEVYCDLHREAVGLAGIRRENAKRIKGLADAKLRYAERLRAGLSAFMERTNQKRIETTNHVVRLQNAGGELGMEITGEVPEYLKKAVMTPDTEAIRSILEKGYDCAFARLKPRGKALVIQ